MRPILPRVVAWDRINAPFGGIYPFDFIVSVLLALGIAFLLKKALWPITEKPDPRPTADTPASSPACETRPPGV